MLHSNIMITAERNRLTVRQLIEALIDRFGEIAGHGSRTRPWDIPRAHARSWPTQAGLHRGTVRLIPTQPVTNRTAWLMGQIEGQEAAKGNILPFNDLMIDAAAIEQDYAVVTENLRHFRKIPGLQVLSF